MAAAQRRTAAAAATPAGTRVCRLHRGDRPAAPRPAGNHLGPLQVGLRPKTAARLVRLNRVWQRLDERRPLDWGQVAADAGYADQAHLIRDFHQFTGTTPTVFRTHPQAQTAVSPPV